MDERHFSIFVGDQREQRVQEAMAKLEAAFRELEVTPASVQMSTAIDELKNALGTQTQR